MGVLQVVGDGPKTGKTCLISALLLQLTAGDKRPAYYKPFSATPDRDADVAFMATQLQPEAAVPSPVARPDSAAELSDALQKTISQSLANLDATHRPLLVEGPDLTTEAAPTSNPTQELAAALSAVLDSRVLLLLGYRKGLTGAAVVQSAAPWGHRLAGIVINNVPQHRQHEIQRDVVQLSRAQELPVLGFIPEDRSMLAVTVQQIADFLGATWVQEPADPGDWVDRFLIGGNIMDSGINYFGRYAHQAVLTRAERPDIQLASLMTATRCLVLTGGAEPTEYIRVEAAKREVPLLLVRQNTLATAATLEDLLAVSTPHHQFKARRFRELVQQHLDPDGLASLLTNL